jgi:F-type H+-transporting ATPase subunit delta
MNAREGGAARRYARAAFELALERGQAAEVRQALDQAAATVAGHRELRLLLFNAAVSGEKKKQIVAALWPARDGAAGLAARLLALLAERHRLDLLERVAHVFGELWNAQRKVLSAELQSVLPLDDGQLNGLRAAVQRATGRDVEFKTAIDARLLGGLRLTMDGRVYDGSVRAQLAALRTRLVEGRESA